MHTYVCNKYYTYTQATVNIVKDLFRVPLHLVALGNVHHWPYTQPFYPHTESQLSM